MSRWDAAGVKALVRGCPPDAVVSLVLEAVGQSGAGPLKGCALMLRARRSDSASPTGSLGQPRLARLRPKGAREEDKAMQQPVEVHVDEHEQIVERVAAIDVAKASGMVCLRIPHETTRTGGSPRSGRSRRPPQPWSSWVITCAANG